VKQRWGHGAENVALVLETDRRTDRHAIHCFCSGRVLVFVMLGFDICHIRDGNGFLTLLKLGPGAA